MRVLAGEAGICRRGNLTGDWDGERDKLEDEGVIPQLVYAGEVFAAPGLDHEVRAAGLLAATIDLELEKRVHEGLGQLHASAFAIHGQGLSAALDDVYRGSGNVAPSDVRLFEAWVEQPIAKARARRPRTSDSGSRPCPRRRIRRSSAG